MSRPRKFSPADQELIAGLVQRHHPGLAAAVEEAARLLGRPVDKATALRYHKERYHAGPEPPGLLPPPPAEPAAAQRAPAAGADGDLSEIARLVALRDAACETARLANDQRDPRLALAATREAMRGTADIDKLRERLEARGRVKEEKRRQVVLYLPQRPARAE